MMLNFNHSSFYLRDQLLKFRVSRALRTMRSFPNFHSEFLNFLQDEVRKEASAALSEKDPPRHEFNLQSLRKFNYKDQLDSYQRTNPILVTVIAATLSKERVSENEIGDISRKGFGGKASSNDISLLATGKHLYIQVKTNRARFTISTTLK